MKILTLNIDWVTNMFYESGNIPSLNIKYDRTLNKSEQLNNNEFSDYINAFKFNIANIGL